MPKNSHKPLANSYQLACGFSAESFWKNFVKVRFIYTKSTSFIKYLTSQVFCIPISPTGLAQLIDIPKQIKSTSSTTPITNTSLINKRIII